MVVYSIKTMRASDIPAVVAIQEAILKHPVSERWRQALEQYIDARPRGCFVAVAAEKPLGYIIGEIKTWGFGLRRSGWLEAIGIHPKHMGGGIGRELGHRLLDYFKKEGVDGVYTNAPWDSGDLLSFFKSLGFNQSGLLNLNHKGWQTDAGDENQKDD